METVELSVEKRTPRGKGAARQLRRAGKVPAVLYGAKLESTLIAVDAREFRRKVTDLGPSHLIRLACDTDGELRGKLVLLKEIQAHPVTGAIVHADFYEVDLGRRVKVTVPLRYTGKAAGVVAGGILQPVRRELEIECLPTSIPDRLEVDVSGLGIRDSLHVSDLTLPEGVRAAGEPGLTLVTVLSPTVEEARPVEGPAAAPEPGAAEAAPPAPAEPAEKGASEE